MASTRSANDSKRIVRIVNHLARSSFGLPGCTLLLRAARWNGDASIRGFHEGNYGVCALLLTFCGGRNDSVGRIFTK